MQPTLSLAASKCCCQMSEIKKKMRKFWKIIENVTFKAKFGNANVSSKKSTFHFVELAKPFKSPLNAHFQMISINIVDCCVCSYMCNAKLAKMPSQ